MNELASASWPDVRDGPLVLVPLGSIEQHGPHLPLETDAVIAEAVARRTAELLGDGTLLAPVLSYGASGEHQMFSGTSSIGTEALRQLLVELGRSMTTWAGRIVFVNAHGGNLQALESGVVQLISESRDVAWIGCVAGSTDAHAGRTETSLMLHLRPAVVRFDRAEPGNTAPISELLPTLIRDGVGAVSANGVLGDPTHATAEEGARCLEAMAAEAATAIALGRPDASGLLGECEERAG